jgi:uncharacterized protein YggT (Ycf19 family)
MSDDKVYSDEVQREAQHRQVKSRIGREVNAEITALADRPTVSDQEHESAVAAELRGKAIRDVSSTERELGRARQLARVRQVIDYGFGVIYTLLAIRLLLALLGARPGADFARWIRALTDPFYAPFKGILPNLTAEGSTVVLSLAFGLAMYGVLHLGIRGLLRLIAVRRAEI